METKLAILKGSRNENTVKISSVPFSVGRCRTANFIIAHVNVSRNHCQIVKECGSWKINDFSSSGTYVNGRLVGKGQSVTLNGGDSIRFGPIESNLCWTFSPLNSPDVHVVDLGVKSEFQEVLESRPEKENLGSNKVIYLYNNKLETNNLNKEREVFFKNSELTLTKRSDEVMLKENEERRESESSSVSEELQKVEEDSSSARKETNGEENSKIKKIEELTKELQQVQSALNDLEEKNNALQGKLAAEGRNNSVTSLPSNLVENLTDLMEAEFQCTICSELFVTAVTLSCTHTFCKYCINLWKKKQKTCPICRKKITNETRSLVVDNYIDKMIENLSSELKLKRETIIKERNQIEPLKKRSRLRN